MKPVPTFRFEIHMSPSHMVRFLEDMSDIDETTMSLIGAKGHAHGGDDFAPLERLDIDWFWSGKECVLRVSGEGEKAKEHAIIVAQTYLNQRPDGDVFLIQWEDSNLHMKGQVEVFKTGEAVEAVSHLT